MTDEDCHERAVTAGGSETERPVDVQGDTAGGPAASGDDPVGTVSIPASATGAEADAIAAAVHAHLGASGRLPGPERDREARRWVVAGRLRGFGADSVPSGDETVTDPWSAASRICSGW